MDERRRQKRGLQRRAEVLDAAIRLIAREGLRSVTHRKVAREASLSVRATTYYFESIEALIEQAFVQYVERALQRFAAIEASAPPEGTTVEGAATALALTVQSDLEADREGLIMEYQLALAVSQYPSLEAPYRRWQSALESTIMSYGRALGSAEPEFHAGMVLAMLRGIELEALARPSEPFRLEATARRFASLIRPFAKERSES